MPDPTPGRTLSLKAYAGDNKTLLAFDFASATDADGLAGFTIQCKPPGQPAYYLRNFLQFPDATLHAQVATEDPKATVNAPIQKYRWVHVTGSSHQGLTPAVGAYLYTVTPRYFDRSGSMQALDTTLGASIKIAVGPFSKGSLSLGFTRGYMQSQAFVEHFGATTQLQPKAAGLLYDTTAVAGTNGAGQNFTYADIYEWMGSTARMRIFALLNSVLQDPTLSLNVFAYDLNEPDVLKILLALGRSGRVRIILDNAALHVGGSGKGRKSVTAEDQFTKLFQAQAKPPAQIVRGSFARYSHDKILIVSRNGTPTQVLTGSTNFSVTGLYVNANHVLVFDDPEVAAEYSKVFEQSWTVLKQYHTPSKSAAAAFASNPLAVSAYQGPRSLARMSITFSPHTPSGALQILGAISKRAQDQATVPGGNVIFAVMQLTGSDTPVYNTLKAIHGTTSLYSYGISDAPGGTHLYAPGSKAGVLVTGKPGKTTLPPPFNQVPQLPGHEVHDKFIVCDLNGDDPVVYCGSSNLATGGEESNGDNLLQIHDPDVAAAFAIEALLLIDHYNFLDRYAAKGGSSAAKKSPATKTGVRPAKKKMK